MSLEKIDYLEVDKIIKQIDTQGSMPLEVLGVDGDFYIAKTASYHEKHEIINEIMCAYLARCWGLKVPDFCLGTIDNELGFDYEKIVRPLKRIKADTLNQKIFFLSKKLSRCLEIDSFFGGFDNSFIKNFVNISDIIKIGVFDLWIGNRDRKPDNPNVLISIDDNNKYFFHPIDHTAAFGHLTNYLEVRDIMLHIDSRNCILNALFSRSLFKSFKPEIKNYINADIESCINCAIQNLDFIFEQIPQQYEFGRKSKQHMKNFFSDTKRNKDILNLYPHYLR